MQSCSQLQTGDRRLGSVCLQDVLDEAGFVMDETLEQMTVVIGRFVVGGGDPFS